MSNKPQRQGKQNGRGQPAVAAGPAGPPPKGEHGDKADTFYSRLTNNLQNIPLVAGILVLVVVVAGLASFSENIQKLFTTATIITAPPPVAYVEVHPVADKTGADSGATQLDFRFANIPANFHVASIKLSISVISPEIPVNDNPSAKVEAVEVDYAISPEALEGTPAEVRIPLDLFRKDNEPYSRARLKLSYAKRGARIGLELRPTYYAVDGKEIALASEPKKISVTLTHRVDVMYSPNKATDASS
jgi:hypothetical protein